MIQVDTTAQHIFDALIEKGASVYLVGGCVRDALLNRPCKDIDVEVYHVSLETLTEVLSGFGHVSTYGHFAISSVDTLPHYDFALPRKEIKTGDKHTDFKIIVDPELSVEQASIRRDLTINALMYDVSTRQIIDLYDGQHDLQNKTLRCIDAHTFKEDPLRVYRVASFMSRLEFDVEENTRALCHKMCQDGMLKHLSRERIEEEYNKILMSDNPALGLMFLQSIGALEDYLSNMAFTSQRPDYHPEGNVLIHTMMVLSVASGIKYQTSDPLGFMWACLLHDIGKPVVSDGYHAKGHEEAGRKLFLSEVQMPSNKKRRHYIEHLIACHMALMSLKKAEDPKYQYYLLLDAINPTPVEDLLLITECDKLGRGYFRSDEWTSFYTFITDLMKECGTQRLTPSITGADLQKYPVPHTEYKDILRKMYLLQCKGNTKEELLRKLEELYGA